MKLNVTKAALAPALAAAARLCETALNPQDKTIVFDARPGALTLWGKNSFQRIAYDVAAEVNEPGVERFDRDGIVPRVGTLGDRMIEIATTGTKVEIRQGKRARYSLGRVTAEYAPEIVRGEPRGDTVGAAAFAGLLARCAPSARDAAGTIPAEAWQTGIKIVGATGKLTAYATNGHTFARASLTFDGSIDALLPPAAGHYLRTILGRSKADVRLAVEGDHFRIFGDGFAYEALCIAAEKYPSLSMLDEHAANRRGTMFRCSWAGLSAALSAVMIGRPQFDHVRFWPTPGGVTVWCIDDSGNESSRFVEGEGAWPVGAHSGIYLAQALEFADGETVEVWHGEPGEKHPGSLSFFADATTTDGMIMQGVGHEPRTLTGPTAAEG